ncbi:serine/threonine-protein kinase [Allocoleopsis sp.]|uniref:serine/threonine protein kinase n=1 Tax=Allocoleopsis sp. TaxID=3088169 RepID=UPI002FD3B923
MTGLSLGDSSLEILRDRYEVQQRLGKKAGRQTLLARDLNTQELVVIKLLSFSSDFNWDDLKLFEREAQTLQSLSHPALPRYLDSFELDTPNGKGFAMVQSYIEAPSLEEHLKTGRTFTEGEIKQLAKALLEILTYLHGQKPPLIHRDIKPSNILLTNRSGNSVGQVYLVDFGSVQTLASQEGRTVTVVGTYGYMPPEQFGGRAVPASDLYSLAATLITLATRAHPADLPQKDMRIEFQQAAHLSHGFTDWLSQMIEPSLDRRFTSTESALQALEQPFRQSNQLLLNKENSVTTVELLWNAVWRSTAMGVVAGGVYGGIYGTAFFPGYGTIFGAYLGGLAGIPLGFANGLFVGIWTRLWYFPLKNPRLHRRVVGTISTLVCTAVALIGFASSNHDINSYLKTFNSVLTVAPAPIAGLSMGLISQGIARWYERESRRQGKR